jgi:hypothetical protein
MTEIVVVIFVGEDNGLIVSGKTRWKVVRDES